MPSVAPRPKPQPQTTAPVAATISPRTETSSVPPKKRSKPKSAIAVKEGARPDPPLQSAITKSKAAETKPPKQERSTQRIGVGHRQIHRLVENLAVERRRMQAALKKHMADRGDIEGPVPHICSLNKRLADDYAMFIQHIITSYPEYKSLSMYTPTDSDTETAVNDEAQEALCVYEPSGQEPAIVRVKDIVTTTQPAVPKRKRAPTPAPPATEPTEQVPRSTIGSYFEV